MTLPGTDQVLLGNGQGLPINSAHTHTHTTLTLNNLLLMQDITKNITSVNKFAKDNCVYFEFHVDKYFVRTQENEVLMQGVGNKYGMYLYAPFQPLPSINHIINGHVSTSTLACVSPYKLWNNRLAHPHHEVLKSTLQSLIMLVPHKSPLDFRVPCCLGKVHRLPSYSHTPLTLEPLI